MTNNFVFEPDLAAKTIHIVREFNAPVEKVWKAYTDPGHKHWVYDKFNAIEIESAISSTGMFCDGDGNPNPDGPKSYVTTKFTSIEGNRTKVDSVITFDDEATIKWFVEEGFKEGTEMTFEQLDELLALEWY